MDLGIEGRLAVVSAGSTGIGRACVRALAKEGAHIATFSRNENRLSELSDEIEALTGRRPYTRSADLTQPESISEFFQAVRKDVGSVEILVANSLGPSPGAFKLHGDSDWLQAFEWAHLSIVRMIREVLPGMQEIGRGAVVSIQSTSIKQPIPGLALSNGVRPAVAGVMKTLALEYGQSGIRFNIVCPGRIMTERFLQVERAHGGSLEERLAQSSAEVPLKRFGQPEEVADAVAFLSSDRAAYITGSILAVDGGNVRSLL